MILLWWSTRTSGCAASIPSRASTTTSFGSLMSFFMTLPSDGLGGWRRSERRGGLEVGGAEIHALDGRGVGRSPAEQDEQQSGDHSGEELRGEVDGQLA